MENEKHANDNGIRVCPKLLGIVHEWDNPWVSLRDDEIVHIEENRELIHWQIMSDGTI